MRISRYAFTAAAALATIALLGACGDDDDDGSSSTPVITAAPTDDGEGLDPCELVTAEEAEEALGEPVMDGERGETPPYESCTYNVESVAVKFVLVQVRTDVSLDDFRSSIADASEFLDEETETVADVGDAAYRLAGLLYAHEGDTEVVMSVVLGVSDENQEDVLETEKDLAIIALDRAE